jgi:hexosaminidase
MKFLLLVSVIFCFLIVDTSSAQTVSIPCPVIPTPVSYRQELGYFQLDEGIHLNVKHLPYEIEKYIVNQLKSIYSISCLTDSSVGDITFRKIKNVPLHSYSIDVSQTITITFSSEESCFYAVNSLLQLIEKKENGYLIPHCFLNDFPKFQWRGLHLDVSRHFFTVPEIKRFLDLMAFYKFNTFHWHLTDDQGWRIEIKAYPKLTEIGAWRDSTVIGHYNDQPRQYKQHRTGGFYTQEEVKDIVTYAQDRYISIVPEIEMPGHSRAALAAYPEYSCTGIKQGVPGLWGVFEDIYCSKPETTAFLQEILSEVITLFPSRYLHIGGDEAPKKRWEECLRCQEVIKKNGLKDEHELQSYFIKEMDSFITSKGKKLIGWDEILEGGLSPNAAVMSWQGEEGGIEAAKQSHFVIMSPATHCYFDHYQSRSPQEPLAIGGFLSLEKVYQFDPIPKGLSFLESKYILGGQANLWTEYIPNMKQLEYMAFPRALAMAQSVWCHQKDNSYEQFLSILKNHQFPFLDRMGVNYSQAVFYPQKEIIRTKDGRTN